jgi:hypothetical protein
VALISDTHAHNQREADSSHRCLLFVPLGRRIAADQAVVLVKLDVADVVDPVYHA